MPGTTELKDCLPSARDVPGSAEQARRVSGIAPAGEGQVDEKVVTARVSTNESTSWQARADQAMASYARGQNESFPALYDALAPKLYAFLVRRVRSSNVAQDVLQQTFLQLHAHRGHFIPGSSVAAYAFAICRRLCIDLKRRARPEFSLFDDASAALDLCLDAGSADGALDAKAALEILRRELERLEPEQYDLFELVYLEGFSHAHVAGILGITTNAVKLRANRLRASLARSLAEHARHLLPPTA